MHHDVNQLHHGQVCLCCTFCEVCSESKYQIVCDDFAPLDEEVEIGMIIERGAREFKRECMGSAGVGYLY